MRSPGRETRERRSGPRSSPHDRGPGCAPPAAAGLRSDVDELIDLGCDLADAGRQTDAEWCFRRAADLGDTVASFNLGNALAAQQRWEEAVAAYEQAIAGGEPDAWRNLGRVLEDARRPRRRDARLPRRRRRRRPRRAACSWPSSCRSRASRAGAGRGLELAVAGRRTRPPPSSPAGAGARPSTRRWSPTLRAGADHFPAARGDLAHLLRDDRPRRPRRASCWSAAPSSARRRPGCRWATSTPTRWRDVEAAEEAYRSGIAAGDVYCHHNLGVLLADRGDLDGAVEQFGLGAAAGDELAAARSGSSSAAESKDPVPLTLRRLRACGRPDADVARR